MGNVISLFSAGRFGTILCRFTQMTDCSGVGEKKKKLLLIESMWEIWLKETGGTEGRNNVDLRYLNLLIPGM